MSYLDLIKNRAPVAPKRPAPAVIPEPLPDLDTELQRLDETYGALKIRLESDGSYVWLVCGEYGRRAVENETGLVYEAKHILKMTPDEFQKFHGIRKLCGPDGGVVEVQS